VGTIIEVDGEKVELNDTLQLTPEQGFPDFLIWEEHERTPFNASITSKEVFSFQKKPRRRIFHEEGIRVFLVENRDGKWIYWGLVHILSTSYDKETDTTSGTFKIIHIHPPDVMKTIHREIDRNPETDFFGAMQSE